MKKHALLFTAACLTVCLLPLIGFLLFPTTRTTENKPMAPAPVLISEGKLNTNFFDDFENWFRERMGLRNELIYADAVVQSNLFAESNVSGVVRGSSGWLYYTSTLDDYQGRSLLSERELYCLSSNLSVVQEYLDSKGISFVVTVPPNKNTLYPDQMPYYHSVIVNPAHNAKLLAPLLSCMGVRYVDLFSLFESRDEVLYLLRDSHWNNKGACLAYNAVMDALGKAHETYPAEPDMTKSADGDLNRMLYSFYGPKETDYTYPLPHLWSFEKGDATVEDGWIVTLNPKKDGTLLMFRDSFANTLIPFLAEEYGTACFSKGMPNALERYLEAYSPDCVVIEKVERNIREYLTDPPILMPPPTQMPQSFTIAQTDTTAEIHICENDVNYYCISGKLDPERVKEDTEVIINVNGRAMRAYMTGPDEYIVYVK
ncbi:MAG: hypothetical protein II781_04860, partial [Clostridia bacterium]|nr:hypothetical protein [Clostridia bacterium]